jgi:hypothetical protein
MDNKVAWNTIIRMINNQIKLSFISRFIKNNKKRWVIWNTSIIEAYF